jgi:hypothetical protein
MKNLKSERNEEKYKKYLKKSDKYQRKLSIQKTRDTEEGKQVY